MNKIKLLAVVSAVLLVLPLLSFAQTIGTNVASAVYGSTVMVTGSCNTTEGGTATFTLTQNGTTVTVGEDTTLGANGEFSTAIGVPTTLNAGPATLTVTCPGDTTASTTLNIVDAATAPIVLSSTALTAGGTVTISGFCPAGDIGESVTLAMNQNGTITILGNATVGAGGGFSGTVTIPTTAAAGPATIVATCPNGDSNFAAVTIAAASAPILVPVGPGGGVTVAPFGGVDAGSGGIPLVALSLVALGATGLALSRRLSLK
jgi:hypothetical protein